MQKKKLTASLLELVKNWKLFKTSMMEKRQMNSSFWTLQTVKRHH